MKKLKKLLLASLFLTGINSGCASFPSLPRPPSINQCTPIFKSKILDHWDCERTDNHEQSVKPPKYVQIGVSIEDWNAILAYKNGALTDWANAHCQNAPIGQ